MSVDSGPIDFFISYNRRDRQWALWIAHTLEELKYTFALQEWHFRPGENFVLKMNDLLERSRRAILVLSAHYLAAEFTHPEWAAMFARDPRGTKRAVLPFRVDDCEPSGLLGQIEYADLGGLSEAEAREVVRRALADDIELPAHVPFPGGVPAVPDEPAAATFPGRAPIHSSAADVARLPVARPGMLRYALDRCLPRAHAWLTRIGTLQAPAELEESRVYLREIRARMVHSLRDHIYLPLEARERSDSRPLPGHQELEAVPMIQHEIRLLLETTQGGDGASAQLSAVNRRSKLIHNVVRAVLRAHHPLVLLGDPGSGKTLTLQEVARVLAEDELRHVFPRLIVYRRLGEFHERGAVGPAQVLEYVRAGLSAALRSRLEALIAARRLVLLLDGMDEMSRDRYGEHVAALSQFALQHSAEVQTLFSCRINDFSSQFRHRQLVLLPFRRSQLREYLRRNLAGFPIVIDGELFTERHLLRRLESGELPLDAGNPFVLWLLCYHLNETHSWPASRSALLASYVDRLYEAKAASQSGEDPPFLARDELVRGLSLLAYLVTERNAGSAIPAVAVLNAFGANDQGWNHLQQLIYTGSRCGLLVEVESRDGNQIRFAHHRLQEYFTARHICDKSIMLDWLERLDAPRWQETICNLVLMGGGGEAVAQLRQSIDTDVAMLIESRQRVRSKDSKHEQESAASDEGDADASTTGIHERGEWVVADRVDLAARIVQEVGAGHPASDQLGAVVERAVTQLVEYGNPSTCVKMLWASQWLSGQTAAAVAKAALSSPIVWVRTRALELLIKGNRLPTSGNAGLANELTIDLGRCQILARLPSYWHALREAGIGQRLALAVAAVLEFILYASLVIGAIGALVLARAYGYGNYQSVPLTLFVLAVVLGAIIGFHRSPRVVWVWVAASAWLFANGLLAVRRGWDGDYVGMQHQLERATFGLALVIPAAALVSLAVHSVGLLTFTTLTNRGKSLRAALRVSWNASEYSLAMTLSICLLAVWGISWALRAGWEALGLWSQISAFLQKLKTYLLDGLPYFGALLVVGLLAAWLLGRRNARVKTWMLSALPLAIAASVGLGVIMVGLDRVQHWTAVGYAVLLPLIALGVIVWLLTGLLRKLWRARKSYPPGAFSVDRWTAALQSADPVAQADLLQRSSHQTLNLDVQSFLEVLREAESLVKQEPATSVYWQQRHDLEAVLRQERRG